MIKRKGIDVSKHQGMIDWEAVKKDGIEFAILRCGYGNDEVAQDDEQFKRNADECTRLAIPFGVYLYSYATSVKAAESEANHVLRLIQGYKLSYPVYYDLEDENTTGVYSTGAIEMFASAFAEKIQAAGYKVGIYASKYWWVNHLPGTIYNQWERWVAQYNSECTYSGEYGMWQYGSAGKVLGIEGVVDVNICYKDYPALIAGNVIAKQEQKEGELPDLSAYTGCSIAAALKECGYDNSFAYREKLATKLQIAGYTGTAEQNLDMIKRLGGKVESNATLKAGAAIRINAGARDLNTGGSYANYVYKNTYTVISIKGEAVVFGIGKAVTGRVLKDNVTLS